MRILLVEGEKIVADSIKRGFEEENFSVDVVHDPEQGIRKATKQIYDLILLDIRSPQKDGPATISKIRKKDISTPILCVAPKDRSNCLDSGFITCCSEKSTRPLSLAELLSRSFELVWRAKQRGEAELFFADLHIDTARQRAWRAGNGLDLTPKEFALLEYFMRHPNQILTRAMIADHVWDYTFDAFTNIIDVYLNYLRKKVDRHFEKKLIHAIRGEGYILKEEQALSPAVTEFGFTSKLK